MKSPLFAIRQGYYTALNGSLMLNGNAVKVGSSFKDSDDVPFVYIGSVNLVDASNKSDYMVRASVLVDINADSRWDAEELSNQITGLLIKSHTNEYVSLDGFAIITSKLESIVPWEEITAQDREYRYRVLLTIENIIQEL